MAISNEKNATGTATNSTVSTLQPSTSKEGLQEELPLKPPRQKKVSQPQSSQILETTIDNVDEESENQVSYLWSIKNVFVETAK